MRSTASDFSPGGTDAGGLLLTALCAVSADYEETCRAVAEGLADIKAGRTISFEEARGRWGRQKAARAQDVKGLRI